MSLEDRLIDENTDLRGLLRRAIDALEDLVAQHCALEVVDGQAVELGDFALSANRDAIELLVELGRLERAPGKLERWRWKR